jgi:hypothetical protein
MNLDRLCNHVFLSWERGTFWFYTSWFLVSYIVEPCAGGKVLLRSLKFMWCADLCTPHGFWN